MVGAVIRASSAARKAKRKHENKDAKWAWLLLGIVALVMFGIAVVVYLNADAPDMISMAAYTYRTYNVKHTYKVIEDEKVLTENRDTVQDGINKSLGEVDTSTLTLPELRDHVMTTKNGMSQEYCDVNNKLLQYCNGVLEDEGISYNVNIRGKTIEFDALLYMTMCNMESGGWMGDMSIAASSIYPAGLLDDQYRTLTPDNCLQLFASLNSTMVLTSSRAYQYDSLPYTPTGSEQGPSTQQFPAGTFDFLENKPVNEHSQYSDEAVKNTILGICRHRYTDDSYNTILNTCTGGTSKHNGPYGDRYNIHDQLCAFYKGQIESSVNQATSTLLDEKCNQYTALALLRLAHWTPAALWNGNDDKWVYINKLAYFISTNSDCVAIMQKYGKQWGEDFMAGRAANHMGWGATSACVAEMKAACGNDFPSVQTDPTAKDYVAYMQLVTEEKDNWLPDSQVKSERPACELVGYILQYMATEYLFS